MYDVLQAKVGRLAGKTYFVKSKKHLKTACLGGNKSGFPELEKLHAKLLAPGQLLGYP